MKKEINVFDYASEILSQLKQGALLTTKWLDQVNTMTISWGTLGIQWDRPIFITFVHETRFTRQLLDKNPEFTVNIPYKDYDNKVLDYCGCKSGRDVDKVKELGLTLFDSDEVSVPAIKELPLTLECRIIYKQMQDENKISEPVKNSCYAETLSSTSSGEIEKHHIAYYGEIVKAYIYEKE